MELNILFLIKKNIFLTPRMRSERQEAYEPSLLQGAVRGLRRGPFQPGVQVRPRARPHSARGGRVARQSGSNIIDIPIKTSLTFLFFLVSDHVLLRPLQALLCHRQQKGAQVPKNCVFIRYFHIYSEKNLLCSNYFNSISKEKPPRGKKRFSSNRCSAK